jgi:hypothetical protein
MFFDDDNDNKDGKITLFINIPPPLPIADKITGVTLPIDGDKLRLLALILQKSITYIV